MSSQNSIQQECEEDENNFMRAITTKNPAVSKVDSEDGIVFAQQSDSKLGTLRQILSRKLQTKPERLVQCPIPSGGTLDDQEEE